MRGFCLDKRKKTLRFGIVVSFDAEDRREAVRQICEKVRKEYPEHTLQAAMDTDFSGEIRT